MSDTMINSIISGLIVAIPMLLLQLYLQKRRYREEDTSETFVFIERTRLQMISLVEQLRQTLVLWEIVSKKSFMVSWISEDGSKKMLDIKGLIDGLYERLDYVMRITSMCEKNKYHKIEYYFSLCMSKFIYVITNCKRGFDSTTSMRNIKIFEDLSETEKALLMDEHGMEHSFKKSNIYLTEKFTDKSGKEVRNVIEDIEYLHIYEPESDTGFKVSQDGSMVTT